MNLTKKQKFSFLLMFSFLAVSFITPIPVSASLTSDINHDFSEEYWSILIDLAGMHLEKDYGPIPEPIGTTDGNNATDSKFFVAYNNLGNVQSLYVALQNFTWNTSNTDSYGCAPFQILTQHFSPPGKPSVHYFVVNRFLGLLAYIDNKTDGDTGVPTENDKMFMGWSFYSKFHKTILNQALGTLGAPSFMLINNSYDTVATPIPQTKIENTYRYGMQYSNLFVLWQYLNVTNATSSSTQASGAAETIGERCVALSMIDYVNFTFITEITSTTTSQNVVKTSTEYDIGNMTDLWIFGENNTDLKLPGYSHNNLSVQIAYYNTTNNAVQKRLNGTKDVAGFSLGVVNTANIVKIDFSKIFLGINNALTNHSFVDPSNDPLGNITKPISSGSILSGGNPIYNIDFASKPNYTLNGNKSYEAPTRVINRSHFSTPLNFGPILGYNGFLGGLVGNASGSSTGELLQYLTSRGIIDHGSFFYVTCFPQWAGGTINQDPTFTAYSAGSGEETSIPGFEPILLSIVGLMGITYVIFRIRRKSKLNIS